MSSTLIPKSLLQPIFEWMVCKLFLKSKIGFENNFCIGIKIKCWIPLKIFFNS